MRFPDAVYTQTFLCSATPAIADVLQVVGGLTVYAVDSCLIETMRALLENNSPGITNRRLISTMSEGVAGRLRPFNRAAARSRS